MTKIKKIQVIKISTKTKWQKIFNVLNKKFKNVKRYSEDLQIINNDKSVCFILANGIVVNWENNEALNFIKNNKEKLFSNLLKKEMEDSFNFQKDEKFKIKNDILLISEINTKTMVSISYALAKSVQIDFCEEAINKAIKKTEEIPLKLAQNGKISMSSKKINKLIGEISAIKFNINVNSLREDKSSIFWEKPELINFYEKTANYLEISERIEVINEKIEALYNVLEILRDERNAKHASILEIIIIVLIVIEVILYLLEIFL